ncbi:MAG: hypothetical protein C7B46_17150 [Sulfobacillus benefaciens]|uniref:Plasmid encoded RepA protein n=1 Tax=Sulfobacillus benefaciens TaxID=453960 RepID=A0A2T2X9M0_9FIRM|nr:MAG: hypothetical protein C7B46_17150 [Sulfobacillus benefaciens]
MSKKPIQPGQSAFSARSSLLSTPEFPESPTEATPGRWARYELQMALLDQVFHSRLRSAAPKSGSTTRVFREITAHYDWHHEHGVIPNGVSVTVTAPAWLDVTAESVLLGILYLSRRQGVFCDAPSLTEPDTVRPRGLAQSSPVGVLDTTRYALLQAAGMPVDRGSYQRLTRLLDDLGRMTLLYRNLVTGESGNDLLIRWNLEEVTDRLRIQINWRLAGAVFGTYWRAMIDLDERQALAGDAAKLAHRWLSAHLWPGKSEWILYTTLIRHIWPETDPTTAPASDSAHRVRLHRVKTQVVPALQTLPGWEITPAPEGVLVHRLSRMESSSAKNR